MDLTAWILIACVGLMVCFTVFRREGFIMLGVNAQPAGYFNVRYTGALQFAMYDNTVAWVKDPSVTQDVTINSLVALHAFWNGKYDIIFLVNAIGIPLAPGQRSHSNPAIEKFNVSKTVGGPPVTQADYDTAEKIGTLTATK